MPVTTRKRKRAKMQQAVTVRSLVKTQRPAQNFVKGEFRLIDGQKTFSIWLTESEIAKGKVKQQVIAKAFRNGYIDSFATDRFIVSCVY